METVHYVNEVTEDRAEVLTHSLTLWSLRTSPRFIRRDPIFPARFSGRRSEITGSATTMIESGSECPVRIEKC